MAAGHNWAAADSTLSPKLMKFYTRKRGQIEQTCAINCVIQGNAFNKDITKHKDLFGFKSIFESIQQFARYRIGALILIGRLCTLFMRLKSCVNSVNLLH